ncbi:ABC transporter ATP-binding protein [Lentibacter algarum]|uniref:ABC transporter ATP-binding protein n=1 Tax=Lentibacter algarum TaxID=576131 RepID=UPI001C067AFD|nr:ABC transporter ATP-binding protein [Lentibacter algarum]MBU2980675.1 ABC transporter ATP-binding protein [Lentibacter algarum]
MIRFENLTKSYRVGHRRKVVIDNLNLTLPTGRSLALLGRNGAGKSTLLNIISGAIPATSGRVIKEGTLSWPVGFGGSLHREMTGAQNVRFVARVYGVDTSMLETFVEDFAELGVHYHSPVRTYSSGMKARLGFGLSMGIKFDTYLIDETTAVGDASFIHKSRAIFLERVKNASAIMVSHQMKTLREFCDSGIVLANGKLEVFEDLDEAIARHRKLNG